MADLKGRKIAVLATDILQLFEAGAERCAA